MQSTFMVKLFMYSKKRRNFTQQLGKNAAVVAVLAAIFLSACGIKGDLYQTPEAEAVEQNSQKQQPNNTSDPVTDLSETNPSALLQE